tara:strand:+ start:561 stop:935 length:375 start_codon:yes stop_codon:yes gene_type:complete
MAADAALFRRLGAEYASLADAIVNPFLTDAEIRVSATFFAATRDYAVAYLALHLYTMAQSSSSGGGGGVGGAVVARRARNWEIRYASSAATANNDLEETSYGRQYLALIKESGYGSPRTVFQST